MLVFSTLLLRIVHCTLSAPQILSVFINMVSRNVRNIPIKQWHTSSKSSGLVATVFPNSIIPFGQPSVFLAAMLLAFFGFAAPQTIASQNTEFASITQQDKALLTSIEQSENVVSRNVANIAKSIGEGNPSLSFSSGQSSMNLNTNALDLKHSTEEAALSLGVGFGPSPGLTAAGGLLLQPRLAIGSRLHVESQYADAVFGVVGDLGDSGLRLKGAINYMNGRQDFDFFRSRESARLSQWGYYGHAGWISPAESDLGLQSFGVSLWGAKAKNHSQFETLTYVDQTVDTWVLTQDRRLISMGSLLGGALEWQYAPVAPMVLQGALGMEQLRFPFSDGSREMSRKPYADLKLSFAVDERNQFSVGGKTGAAETRVQLEWKRPSFALEAFKAKSIGREDSRWGIGVNFEVLTLLNGEKVRGANSLASTLRPRAGLNSSELLQTAMERPMQLPSTFLAKVDPTGIKRIMLDKAALPVGSEVDSEGNLRITVGRGQGVVVDSQRNGTSFTDNIYQMEDNVLIVNVASLSPALYAVTVSDGDHTVWELSFETVAKQS
ncbi:hypothetical protein LQR30_22975 [Chromobacterium piscinae]|uniref:hypothetical protein n=1 Tax=Chromobacterium piscinae TaxID=686831 RepID=UPI001E3502AE|nr:hypothetical protein [Chromobacterium piscinae]MCD4506936.1 hypothetical protein [Chromobacterium piscinae]